MGYAAGQLTSRSTVLKDAVAAGQLSIRNVYFDIGSGKVSLLLATGLASGPPVIGTLVHQRRLGNAADLHGEVRAHFGGAHRHLGQGNGLA